MMIFHSLFRHRHLRYSHLVSLSLLLSLSSTLFANTLEAIQARGYLMVGVKTDYAPYGYLDELGNVTGLEIDLAKDIADRIGIEFKLTPVLSTNRMQYLVEKKVDLLIATLSDRPERRHVVSFVEPAYYASGTNILARQATQFYSWEQLFKRKVCGVLGSFYSYTSEVDYGAKMKLYENTEEALFALENRQCLAFVYDASYIQHLLQQEIWHSQFELPLKSIKPTPWGIAVASGDPQFEQYLSDIVIDWHQAGFILELEKKYQLKASQFALKMHETYRVEDNPNNHEPSITSTPP